ncbi:AEC family transporter [Hydrogenophaga sp. 5NK40-0174]|uniref:AEC family transporter n=1 Tax=Hydrogenophaga sp. 5NK40-0174 TaxID=3127649 RepID=UPI0031085B69
MLDILSITGPIYLCILTGYVVTRMGLFTREDMRVFGKFVINLALPSLLFNALSQRSVNEILNGQYLTAYAVAGLLTLSLGFAWARWGKGGSMSHASMMAMGMSCPNSGFVGYPTILLTLGASTAGVSLALNMMVENLLIIPILLALADMDADGKGDWHQAFKRSLLGLVRNPLIIAIVLGMMASFAGWQLPGPIARSVDLFAKSSGALSLFVIGGGLVGLKVHGMKATVAQIGMGKLVLHPLVMCVALLFIVPVHDPLLRTAALLTCAMPMMGIYPILSQRHGHEGVSSAALLVATAASFVSLNLLLWGLGQVPGWLPG